MDFIDKNIIIDNQKKIDKLFGIELSDEFYISLIEAVKDEFGQITNFNFSVDFIFSTLLFSTLHEALWIFKNEYEDVENFYFNLDKELDSLRRVEIVWNILQNKKLIELEGFNTEIQKKILSVKLRKEQLESVLMFLISKDHFVAKYDYDKHENLELFSYINSKGILDFRLFCIYLGLVEMYQDVDLNIYSQSIDKLNNTLAYINNYINSDKSQNELYNLAAFHYLEELDTSLIYNMDLYNEKLVDRMDKINLAIIEFLNKDNKCQIEIQNYNPLNYERIICYKLYLCSNAMSAWLNISYKSLYKYYQSIFFHNQEYHIDQFFGSIENLYQSNDDTFFNVFEDYINEKYEN
jgi:hypothetical protein